MNVYDEIKLQNVITVTSGSTYTDTVLVETAVGVPLNLTLYTVRSMVRNLAGALIGSFTCMTPTPTNGKILRTLPQTITALMLPSYPTAGYVWGIELTVIATGITLPEIQGGAYVLPEIVK